jgi:CRP-like cAMP-binding protein
MPKNSQHNIEQRTFAPSELIPLKTGFYWLLQQGIVKTCTWTEAGHPITLGYWGAKDIVGQPLSLVEPCRITCLTEVQALLIPVHKIGKVSSFIYRHVQQTEELLYILRSDKMYERLRKMLFWLGQKFGTEIEIGRLIEMHITHQDLAEVIGATRVTVTKLVNQLEKEGFLSRPERNTIVLLNQ